MRIMTKQYLIWMILKTYDMTHGSGTTNGRGHHETKSIRKEPTALYQELLDTLVDVRRFINPVEQLRPLTVAEAAKALRCRRTEVERLIDDGKLPVIKRHGRRYLLPADVHRRLREESENDVPNNGRKTHRRCSSRPDSDTVDPRLPEFFD